MRIHHLDCATMCPMGGLFLNGRTRSLGGGRLVGHCLLVETDRDGLVLVDTGLGLRDVASPNARIGWLAQKLLRPRLDPRATAVRTVERLGFRASDVRHLVLTHLDFDHAGGIDDFPSARVHLLEAERRVARVRTRLVERLRYRPEQWSSERRWKTYEPVGERWFDFDAVRPLEGLAAEILLVPLPGPTLGHAGVAVRAGSRWLLHAGDAYFYREEMNLRGPRCPPGLRLLERWLEQDRDRRLENQHRLRQLAREHGDHVQIFCSHDPTELELLAETERPMPIERGPVLRHVIHRPRYLA